MELLLYRNYLKYLKDNKTPVFEDLKKIPIVMIVFLMALIISAICAVIVLYVEQIRQYFLVALTVETVFSLVTFSYAQHYEIKKSDQDIKEHKVFITNLGKCTQIDARPLTNNYFLDYLPLLEKEIKIIKPKIIILFGNQVSSIFLNQKISVSQTRKQYFEKKLSKETYKCFPIFYPVGNGRFNIDKSIEDINYIIKNYIEEK